MLRRGQLTMFVIVGLILLVLVGLVYMLMQGESYPSVQAERDAARVTQFTESCLDTTGLELLHLMGTQGGYVELGRFKDVPDERDTQIITLPPQKIPLWNEFHSCSESSVGCYGNNRPPLCRKENRDCPVNLANENWENPSMEQQLEEHIAAQIDACLDFRELPDLTVERKGKPTVDVDITEQTVFVSLDYPLEVTTADGNTVELDTYTTSYPLQLPMMYRLASEIQQEQVNLGFLEEIFLHLISVYAGVDEPLPPIRDVELFGSMHFWTRSKVQQTIEQDILPYMNFVQIMNALDSFSVVLPSDDIDPAYAQYASGLYEYFNVKLHNESYPLEARFEYPYTPMYLDINGKEFLKPTSLVSDDFLSRLTGMFFAQYKFSYTAQWPVLVHVRDREALNGQGYELTFGLEGAIYNNHPVNMSLNYASVGSSLDALDLNDPGQLVDHIYDVKVKDRHTGEPLADANVQFSCGQRWQMGVTSQSGSFAGKLPYCFAGGAIIVEKYGYVSDGVDVANMQDDAGRTTLEVALWPRKQKLVTILRRTDADIAAMLAARAAGDPTDDIGQEMTNDTYAFVMLERAKENAHQDEVPLQAALQFGKLSGSSGSSLSGLFGSNDQLRGLINDAAGAGGMTPEERDTMLAYLDEAETVDPAAVVGGGSGSSRDIVLLQSVDLVPGEYALDGMLLYNGLIQIPLERRCEGSWPFKECFDLPAQNFSSFPIGGVILNGPNSVRFSESWVYSDRPLTLYVIEQPIPRNWTAVEEREELEDYITYARRTAAIPGLN